jgi:hypothetical protein
VIDKHTNIATGIERSELLGVLRGKGTKMDKLRFAIMYLISSETINLTEVEAVETALRVRLILLLFSM